MTSVQLWRLLGFMAITSTRSITHSHNHQPCYLLLAPTSLHPGAHTSISVTILSSSPHLVSADIIHGDQKVAMNSTTIKGGSTQLLTLPPIQQSEFSHSIPYYLNVRGYVNNVEVFSNKTELHFDPKCVSTFIQMDKPSYCPGQAVRIRVVSIKLDGKPNNGSVDIAVRDPRGNLLRQWLDVEGVHGVVSKEFQLSENPPVGPWSIAANVAGVWTEKHFTVAKYVLPEFNVKIEVPKRVHRNDVLKGSVHAKYLYGEAVRGHVNVTFIYHLHGREDAFYEHMQIDGMADFMFDIPAHRHMEKSHLGMAFYDGYTDDEAVIVVVHVTEHLTGFTCNSVTTVSVAKFRYEICFESYTKILRPALNFVATLKISTFDNKQLSLEDQQKSVRVSVMQKIQNPWNWKVDEMVELGAHTLNSSVLPSPIEAEEMEFPISADGLIYLHIPIKNNTEMLTIDAYFEDSHNSLQLYRTYSSPSHSYLQIQKPPTPVQVGSPVTLHIESNFPVSEIHYLVKAKGQVVSAGTSTANVSLVPEFSWAPLACILVYCVHPSGEIVNDVMQLPITQTFNKVSLSWSDTEVEPGEDVALRVTAAEPASLVAVLVVDKATKREGSHHNINKDSVLQEMAHYGLPSLEAYFGFRMGDPYSVFKICDLVVLTDATLHAQNHRPNPEVLPEDGRVHKEEGNGMEEDENIWGHVQETWIWTDVNTGDSVSSAIQAIVPDRLTTWVATAFVMSENLGLGFGEAPVELTAFKDFFLSLNLPASVIRGEELLLGVVLFNYLPHDVEVTVIVAESDAFHFVFPDRDGLTAPIVNRVFVESQGGASVHIPIRPLVLGEIPISVKAMTPTASDSVRRTVTVKAEGLEQFFSTSLLLEVSSSQPSLSRHVTFNFPADFVMGSDRVSVTVVGDILGPSINGLEDLIRMPHGCGEQNMINFAPNVYVLQYLNATGTADAETTARAIAYMTSGYERELTYQRADGSFSAFGNSDAAGSTWLSAFVLRCFLQARPFISIEANVLETVAAWLIFQQGVDGRFEEHGRVIHTELQGGLDGPVSLTAYVFIALMEDQNISGQYGAQVTEALMFLETRLALGITSNYSLSLVAYALALAGSSSAETALQDLIGRAELKDGVPTWSSPNAGASSSWQPRSADIEMTAYVLLTQHKLGLIAEGVKLMKWLSQQRNDRGGFRGTQDTVVALQALATWAALSQSHDIDLTVRVDTDEAAAVAVFYIDHNNYLLHQSRQIEAEEGLHLQVTAEGRGLALFQLNVFYNVWSHGLMRKRRDTHEAEAFHLNVKLFDLDSHAAHLFICSSLVKGLSLNATGMALMEVGLLSGFVLSPDGIQINDIVKKVETMPGKVIVYLDSVTTEEMCLTLPLIIENKVARVQEASVIIYDYYETSRRTTQTYNSDWRKELTSSDLCSELEDDCTGSIFDDAATLSRHGILLSCLWPALFLVFFNC
ncbi:CD109 antigen [Takifugu rubripes]|uniref:CD109 antigen n=1 Tax=Takifugu rubripes TaxID=31033 RepID=UPI001145DC70|nr:CD109 antigen [Takifugu rubripes]